MQTQESFTWSSIGSEFFYALRNGSRTDVMIHRNNSTSTTVRLHKGSRLELRNLVVTTLDVNVRAKEFNQISGTSIRHQRYCVHASQPRNYRHSEFFLDNRSQRVL